MAELVLYIYIYIYIYIFFFFFLNVPLTSLRVPQVEYHCSVAAVVTVRSSYRLLFRFTYHTEKVFTV
jgi:uncharacterized membrane-anchored protein YitT (DUF2179 family)